MFLSKNHTGNVIQKVGMHIVCAMKKYYNKVQLCRHMDRNWYLHTERGGGERERD